MLLLFYHKRRFSLAFLQNGGTLDGSKGQLVMKSKQGKSRSGLTLIEIMVAIVVIIVGVLGAVMYRYGAALDARKADVHVGASRVALLILEGWKGAAGAVDASGNIAYFPHDDIPLNSEFDEGSDDITITSNGSDNYTIYLTGGTSTYYYAQLTYNEDVDGDSTDDDGIRKLEVKVTYYGRGSQDTSLPKKTIKISDFVRTNPN